MSVELSRSSRTPCFHPSLVFSCGERGACTYEKHSRRFHLVRYAHRHPALQGFVEPWLQDRLHEANRHYGNPRVFDASKFGRHGLQGSGPSGSGLTDVAAEKGADPKPSGNPGRECPW